jgi:hypothetical protein
VGHPHRRRYTKLYPPICGSRGRLHYCEAACSLKNRCLRAAPLRPIERSWGSFVASEVENMGDIERRKFIQAAAAGGVALSMPVAEKLFGPSEARAEDVPPRAAPDWPNRRLIDLLKIEHPIIQAPMGGAVSPNMPVAVGGAGGLGSFPCSFWPLARSAMRLPKSAPKSPPSLLTSTFSVMRGCGTRQWKPHGSNGSAHTTPSWAWTP